MGEIVVSATPPHMLALAWDEVAPLIQKALDRAHGEMSLEDVRERIESNSLLLVNIHRDGVLIGANTLEIVTKPGVKYVGIVTVGGRDVDEWIDEFLDVVATLAKEQGATEIRAAGREGWSKKLHPRGFDTAYTVYRMEI